MSNPTRIGQEAPDLKTPSSPSRITPTRAIDDAEKQMTPASRRRASRAPATSSDPAGPKTAPSRPCRGRRSNRIRGGRRRRTGRRSRAHVRSSPGMAPILTQVSRRQNTSHRWRGARRRRRRCFPARRPPRALRDRRVASWGGAGVVGAGGNVGAVAWGLMFMFGSSGPQGYRHLGIIIILSAFLTLGINIRGAGSLFRNDMDSTIERRARGDDDDESFHTASALTPSSLASVPA